MIGTSFTVSCLFAILSSSLAASTTKKLVCADFPTPSIPGADVTSQTTIEQHNFTVAANPFLGLPHDVNGLNICTTLLFITHHGASDNVTVWIWLPIDNWNGRFLAEGGGGYQAGFGPIGIAPGALEGFAMVTTDAGIGNNTLSVADWALKEDGSVNVKLLRNFGSRSIHDTVLAGKSLINSYYGKEPKYSYWYGCSTGGRQGLEAAQSFPDDFDGILAGAPALAWNEMVVGLLYPQVVMIEEGVHPSQCEIDAIVQAAITSCDELDGVKDRTINEPSKCHFDPLTLAGSNIVCAGQNITITLPVTNVVQRLWDGLKPTNGQPTYPPLEIGAQLLVSRMYLPDMWIPYFLKANPRFDINSVNSSTELTALISESLQKYGNIIESTNPDLSPFRNSGGKLLVWQGDADQVLSPKATLNYRHEVEERMGGGPKVDEFFRLFLAPGVDHCGLGTTPGAAPEDPFSVLRSWVENDTAPEILAAETPESFTPHFTRKLCRYPLVSKYRGGDPNVLESFDCVIPV